MMRTTTMIACAAALATLSGCAASAQEIREAESSAYNAKFATVFGQTLAAVRERYPKVEENASEGWIKTSWHPVRVASTQPGSSQTGGPQGTPATGQFSQSVSPDSKQYYIRFRLYVRGGQPWRVRIEAEAAEWEGGAVPAPLKRAELPHWVNGRTNALRVAIHERLINYAVKYSPRSGRVAVKGGEQKAPRSFGELPKAAAGQIAAVYDALLASDFSALRLLMADDFVWSLGAAPNADQGLVMFQADNSRVSLLINALNAGCRLVGKTKVTCPPDFDEAQANAYTGFWAEFGLVDGVWKMTQFTSNQ